MTSVASVVEAAVARLCTSGFSRDDGRRDAVVLARGLLGWSLADWLSQSNTKAPPAFEATFDNLVSRRALREPVAYLLGTREFYGRAFRVDPHTLIPRPETEGLVDVALAWVARREPGPNPRIIDVGTGTGCVAVTLALELPATSPPRMAATDISAAAIDVARDNAARLGAATVTFHHGRLLADAHTPVDLVISNPPYVPQRDRDSLEPDVVQYEPHTALFAGHDGLEVIRHLIPEAHRALAPGGALMMEIGIHQSDVVGELLRAAGFVKIERHPDLQGIPRTIVGHKPPASH
jgi:release factor glutamine methyltransferase